MVSNIKCCKGCIPPKRTPTCHATCPDYIREKAENEATRKEIIKILRVKRRLSDQRRDSLDKAMRKNGRQFRDASNK